MDLFKPKKPESSRWIHGRYFIAFKTEETRKKFKLPAPCKRNISYGKYLSLSCEVEEHENFKTKLSKHKNIKKIHNVENIRSLAYGHNFPNDPYAKEGLSSSGLDSTGQCLYNDTCPDGRAKFWAQQRISGDLMFSFLKEQGIRTGTVNVAVVDSGFDEKTNKELMASPDFSVHKGHDKAGNPTLDQSGHGTAVSGLIGGKDGVGLAPNAKLKVYRVTVEGDTGSTSSDLLKASIMKACDDGAEVINVSWGGYFDERGIGEEEEEYKELYEELFDKGCLIVKSAGNSARRVKRDHMDPDDNLLRVEASEVSGAMSYFTSNGEIRAPGSGVFTHRSAQVGKDRYDNYCGKARGSFVNGTSFAAPITSAIAAQVAAVLKHNHYQFKKLPGRDRVKWITRVLRAASHNGNLDANRAVRIASMDMKDLVSQQPIPSAEALKKEYAKNEQPFCTASIGKCTNPVRCPDRKNCLSHMRSRLSRCAPPSQSDISTALKLAERLKANDVALGVLQASNTDGKKVSSAKHAQARTIWNRLHKSWKANSKEGKPVRIPFDQALEMLPIILQKKFRSGSPSDAFTAMREFLNSSETKGRLNRDKKAQSSHDVEKVAKLVTQFRETYGDREANKLLDDTILHWFDGDDGGAPKSLVGATRVWSELKTNKDHKSSTYLGEKLIAASKKVPLDSLPQEDDYLDALYDDPAFKKSIEESKPEEKERLSLLDWHSLVNHQDRVPKEKRPEYFLSMIERYNMDEKNTQWGEGKLLGKIMDSMYSDSAENPENYNNEVVKRFWDYVNNSDNPAFLSELNPHFGGRMFSKIEDARKSPFLKGNEFDTMIENHYKKFIASDEKYMGKYWYMEDLILKGTKFLPEKRRDSLQLELANTHLEKLKNENTLPIYGAPPSFNVVQVLLKSSKVGKRLISNPSTLKKIQETIDSLKKHKKEEFHQYGSKLEEQLEDLQEIEEG